MKLFYPTKHGVIAPRWILRIAVAFLMISNIAWLGWGLRFGEMFHSKDYWQDLLTFSLIGVVIGELVFRMGLYNAKRLLPAFNMRRYILIQSLLGVLLPWLLLYGGGHYLPEWLGMDVDTFYYFRYRLPYALVWLMVLNILYVGCSLVFKTVTWQN
ncbi:hypothetical protein EDD80_1258 [Anseongella ginsenosidimutans]|uniref:Uncharacterized protein n=1 Tax=Anseongella ginsenosidimutans TaxID=496056 RepID=A0A4R3KK06_9SPHI|nr:hypothetical protein [Anseongella ginsenosidimutans]QEC53625.1 hypothetical protein FRZ59_15630 [Anseongella ginsenosidimutans]TCS83917.1 hypothetical protein EDD80_1258 [Anseongella ginsenosidimutans]